MTVPPASQPPPQRTAAATPARRTMLAGLTTAVLHGAPAIATHAKKRVFIVCSYHRAYLWSQSTQRGVSAAMRRLGWLESDAQVAAL